jgi:hypothetical protein
MSGNKRSGCAITLYIMGAVGLLVLLIGVIVLIVAGVKVTRFVGSEQGQKLIEGMGEAIEMAQESENAPGAAELREAGCDSAMVTTTDAMLGIIGAFADEEDMAEIENIAPPGTVWIICNATFGGDPMDCGDVARIYGEAVPTAEGEILVQAEAAGRPNSRCFGFYAPDGTLIREADPEALD